MNAGEIDSFDWDEGNTSKNWLKHQVTPSECEEAFFNKPLLVADDPSHSEREARYFALGRTNAGRLLFLAFTYRGTKIRVISARDMSRKERVIYAEADSQF